MGSVLLLSICFPPYITSWRHNLTPPPPPLCSTHVVHNNKLCVNLPILMLNAYWRSLNRKWILLHLHEYISTFNFYHQDKNNISNVGGYTNVKSVKQHVNHIVFSLECIQVIWKCPVLQFMMGYIYIYVYIYIIAIMQNRLILVLCLGMNVVNCKTLVCHYSMLDIQAHFYKEC